MSINGIFLSIYRKASLAALSLIIIAVITYVFLVIFFFVNKSWAAPIILSPSQERVLAFQPQIANLEAQLTKQRIELATAQSTLEVLTVQLTRVRRLRSDLSNAINVESNQQAITGSAITTILTDKKVDVTATLNATASINRLLKTTENELKAGLITKDQAEQRRISLQAALNSATEMRAQALALETQVNQLASSAKTLKGGSTSIAALSAVKQSVELITLQSQLTIQIETARATVAGLDKTIQNAERVEQVAKASPYYRALREVVTIAFVPYENTRNLKPGVHVYECYLRVIFCRRAGVIASQYDPEEYAKHPLFKTDLKGVVVEIVFYDPELAKSPVIFIKSAPLFL